MINWLIILKLIRSELGGSHHHIPQEVAGRMAAGSSEQAGSHPEAQGQVLPHLLPEGPRALENHSSAGRAAGVTENYSEYY